jgi:hypothetical protein
MPGVLWSYGRSSPTDTFKDDPRQAMLVDKSLDQLNQLSNAYCPQYLYSKEDGSVGTLVEKAKGVII